MVVTDKQTRGGKVTAYLVEIKHLISNLTLLPMAMPLPLLSDNNSLPLLESQVSNMTHVNVGNQGLQKKILRKGNSWKSPSLGDQIQGSCNVVTASC